MLHALGACNAFLSRLCSSSAKTLTCAGGGGGHACAGACMLSCNATHAHKHSNVRMRMRLPPPRAAAASRLTHAAPRPPTPPASVPSLIQRSSRQRACCSPPRARARLYLRALPCPLTTQAAAAARCASGGARCRSTSRLQKNGWWVLLGLACPIIFASRACLVLLHGSLACRGALTSAAPATWRVQHLQLACTGNPPFPNAGLRPAGAIRCEGTPHLCVTHCVPISAGSKAPQPPHPPPTPNNSHRPPASGCHQMSRGSTPGPRLAASSACRSQPAARCWARCSSRRGGLARLLSPGGRRC